MDIIYWLLILFSIQHIDYQMVYIKSSVRSCK
jgi:hypothetical protein